MYIKIYHSTYFFGLTDKHPTQTGKTYIILDIAQYHHRHHNIHLRWSWQSQLLRKCNSLGTYINRKNSDKRWLQIFCSFSSGKFWAILTATFSNYRHTKYNIQRFFQTQQITLQTYSNLIIDQYSPSLQVYGAYSFAKKTHLFCFLLNNNLHQRLHVASFVVHGCYFYRTTLWIANTLSGDVCLSTCLSRSFILSKRLNRSAGSIIDFSTAYHCIVFQNYMIHRVPKFWCGHPVRDSDGS